MYPTHIIGTLIDLLGCFSEAQLIHPIISNDKEVGYLLYDYINNKVLWNYDFKMYEDEIHNTNKTRYSQVHHKVVQYPSLRLITKIR